jgi:hypothetical protein
VNVPLRDQLVVDSESVIEKSVEIDAVPVFRTVRTTRPSEIPSPAHVNCGLMSDVEMERSGIVTVACVVIGEPLLVHEYSEVVLGSPSSADAVQPHVVTAVLVRRATEQSLGGAARRAVSVTI